MSLPPVMMPVGFTPKPTEAAADPAEVAEIERLRETHGLYDKYKPLWDLYLASYEGGVAFANEQNLFRHQRENPEDFLDRSKRIHYLNYIKPLVDFFTTFIYSETISRQANKGKEEWYADFRKNVNRKGDDDITYMKQVCKDMQVFGMSYTLIDMPMRPVDENGDLKVLSKAQEQELGLSPYWCLIKPDEILDWQTDDFDQYLYIKRCQYKTDKLSGETRHLEIYTEWYLDRVVRSVVDITDSAKPKILEQPEMPNALGKIPFVVVRYQRSDIDRFIGQSMLSDLSFNARQILNLTSLLDEFLYRQCFNQMVKEAEPFIPSIDQQEGDVGTANVIEYPKGGNAPQYLSPPVDPAKFLVEERQRISNEMFKQVAQDTMNELFNGEKRSGFSQAQSFSKTVPHIATRADALERAEHAFMSLTMEMMGETWEGSIKYKDRYEITNISDAISQLSSLVKDLMLPSPTFVKHEFKRLVEEYDGKMPLEIREKVMSEIESKVDDKYLESLKQAAGGVKPPAPAPKTGTMEQMKRKAQPDKVSASTKQEKPAK
jgi:hypothetical protein